MLPSAPTELIELSGPDAAAFAQAQFCNDVEPLRTGDSQLNAWLTPQGRVRRLFHLIRADDRRYLLLLRGGSAAAVLPPLRMFVLRLKVDIRQLNGWHWAEAAAGSLQPGDFNAALPDSRQLILRQGSPVDGLPFAETLARDIDAGLPWLPDHALEQILPSWLTFARLGAISHTKGCYPGQEIVARLHFRGGGDKRVPVRLSAPSALIGATELRDGGSEAGLLLQWVPAAEGGSRALAVVRRESAESGMQLQAAEHQLSVLASAWT
ncbi:MAG: folate-binding protein [Rhodanobacteraceae bacterium]|nr:folate-binding protein [Rhodanobacteraceae bacterium]